MPFRYSKLTDESPSFFLLYSLEFSKILLYYDNIKPEAAAGGGDSAYAKKFPSTLK